MALHQLRPRMCVTARVCVCTRASMCACARVCAPTVVDEDVQAALCGGRGNGVRDALRDLLFRRHVCDQAKRTVREVAGERFHPRVRVYSDHARPLRVE